jgi:hypothetical protein
MGQVTVACFGTQIMKSMTFQTWDTIILIFFFFNIFFSERSAIFPPSLYPNKLNYYCCFVPYNAIIQIKKLNVKNYCKLTFI